MRNSCLVSRSKERTIDTQEQLSPVSTDFFVTEIEDSANAVCPYIGLQNEMLTRFSFPSIGNHCHRSDTVVQVDLDYLSSACYRWITKDVQFSRENPTRPRSRLNHLQRCPSEQEVGSSLS